MDPNTTCFVMLSQNFKNIKPSELKGNWYTSEKYDGIRAIWDPQTKQLLTRSKRPFNYVPEWFIKLMPSIPLEGEILVPGKPFRYFSGITVMKEYDSRWEESVFYVFDTPQPNKRFVERKVIIEQVVNCIGSKYIKTVDFELVKNIENNLNLVHSKFQEMVNKGKEGIMLIRQDNIYQPKRVKTILKYKKEIEGECEVIDYLEGTGKYEGMLGKLRCRLSNGKEFNVGSGFSDVQRGSYVFEGGRCVNIGSPCGEEIPKRGDRITYSCMEITTTGIPRLPIYKSLRNDL